MADKNTNDKVKVQNSPTEKTVDHKKNGVDQLDTVEPTKGSQSNKPAVSEDSPVSNPDSGDYTPSDFKVADTEGKTAEQQQRDTQDGLNEQLNRKPERR